MQDHVARTNNETINRMITMSGTTAGARELGMPPAVHPLAGWATATTR